MSFCLHHPSLTTSISRHVTCGIRHPQTAATVSALLLKKVVQKRLRRQAQRSMVRSRSPHSLVDKALPRCGDQALIDLSFAPRRLQLRSLQGSIRYRPHFSNRTWSALQLSRSLLKEPAVVWVYPTPVLGRLYFRPDAFRVLHM